MRAPAFITGADPGYYQVLGVASDAGHAEIAAAYRALMRRHHPDAAGDHPSGEDMAKRVTEAFSVLGHPDLRGQYDAVHGYPRPAAPTATQPAGRTPPPRRVHRPSGPPPEEHGVSAMMVFALFIAVAAVILVAILVALSQEQRAVLQGPSAAADGAG